MTTELTKVQKAMSYVNTVANKITTDSREQRWLNNVRANKETYAAGNATLRGLTAFIVCAGPSLEKNAEQLKKMGRLGIIICVDAALRHLLEVGVKPDYCISIDSDGRCMRFIEGLDTEGITLICMTTAAPEVVQFWKGPRYFVGANGGGDGKLFAMSRQVKVERDLKVGDYLDPIDDISIEFPGVIATLNCGGNVSTAAASFAYEIIRACKLVFVGADFSWPEDPKGDSVFYAGDHYKDMAKERKTSDRVLSHPGQDDEQLSTNMSLFAFKQWHGGFAGRCPNTHVNASEGGILGIGNDKYAVDGSCGSGEKLSGWEFLTLAEAIEKYTKRASE